MRILHIARGPMLKRSAAVWMHADLCAPAHTYSICQVNDCWSTFHDISIAALCSGMQGSNMQVVRLVYAKRA